MISFTLGVTVFAFVLETGWQMVTRLLFGAVEL
jgi:hypothetical protein